MNDKEDTLRLQFGTISSAISANWLDLQLRNQLDKRIIQTTGHPRVVVFESKGRVITRNNQFVKKEQNETPSWNGNVQIYDQEDSESLGDALNQPYSDAWNWDLFSTSNLFEVGEFASHLPLHNFYEGYASSNGGTISNTTLEAAFDVLRGHLESCNYLRQIECFVDMDSAWGGFSIELLRYLQEECKSAYVTTFGNDYPYPLATLPDNAFLSIDLVYDKRKVQSRRCINLNSSLASLIELSTVLVPLSLNSTSGVNGRKQVALAIELALSAHRDRPAYEFMQGFSDSRNIVELSANVPYTDDLSKLSSALMETSLSSNPSALELLSWLPNYAVETTAAPYNIQSRVYYRRIHLKGKFKGYNFQNTLEQIRNPNCSIKWSPSPVTLFQSASNDPMSLVTSTQVDGISQLLSSTRIALYLQMLSSNLMFVDRRVLHEFVLAGMEGDELNELAASLGKYQQVYES